MTSSKFDCLFYYKMKDCSSINTYKLHIVGIEKNM